MKQITVALLTFVVSILLLPFDQPAVHSEPALKRAMVFAVWPPQKERKPSLPIIDPIVMVEGSRLQKPPEYSYDDQKASDAVFDRFGKKYYASGNKYPLLLGGGEIGAVIVNQPTDLSCISNAATVRLSTPLPKGEMALAATSTQGFGLHPDWREAATDEQHSAFLNIAAVFLKQKEIPGILASSIKVNDLRSTKLGADRPKSLIGSVTVKGKSAVRHVFLIATEEDGQYVVSQASYNVTKDVEDYTDNVEESFVGQLDLDNDGVDEIVTITYYYESWSYTIYKEQQGKWRKVYQGGGGGC